MSTNLSQLNDSELHASLQSKTLKEREILVDVIAHIHEADRRRLYLKYSYTSLFEYLVKEMNYHGGSAQRRIDAARLLGDVPEIRPDIASGALNLTQLTAVAQGFKQKKRQEQEVKAKSNRESSSTFKQALAVHKRELLEKVKNQKLPEVQKIVAETLNIEVKTYERKTVQRDSSIRVELTLSAEQVVLLEKVKSLISHTHPNPTIADVLVLGLKELQRKKDPLLRGIKKAVSKDTCNATSIESVGSNPSEPTIQPITTSVVVNIRKPIASATKRELFEKHECCQWRNEKNGEVCGSTFQLQSDHILSVWAGGSNESENLQVLCSRHNQLKYLKEIGRV